jgi:hypothetical protein
MPMREFELTTVPNWNKLRLLKMYQTISAIFTIIAVLIFLPYVILGFYALRYLIKKPKGKKQASIETVLAEEKRYLKHVASICESFVEDGAESAYQSILSLTRDGNTYSILTLPWLFDTILGKGKASQSGLESLEKFMEISGIKSSGIPYPQAERMLKSLILSEIPCEQKEKITESPILSEFSHETRRAMELKLMDPATRKKAEKTEAGQRTGQRIRTLIFWAISIILFFWGIAIIIASILDKFGIPGTVISFSIILYSVLFFLWGMPKNTKTSNLLAKPGYPKKIEVINDNFAENGAEGAYQKILSLVMHDKAEAKENAIQAIPLIADTLLGKDALTPEDRASFIKFMEISGVDSSQIPDELKERIVQSFFLSKIPYEQKEGLLRPIIMRAKSNASAAGNDEAQIRVVDNS